MGFPPYLAIQMISFFWISWPLKYASWHVNLLRMKKIWLDLLLLISIRHFLISYSIIVWMLQCKSWSLDDSYDYQRSNRCYLHNRKVASATQVPERAQNASVRHVYLVWESCGCFGINPDFEYSVWKIKLQKLVIADGMESSNF